MAVKSDSLSSPSKSDPSSLPSSQSNGNPIVRENSPTSSSVILKDQEHEQSCSSSSPPLSDRGTESIRKLSLGSTSSSSNGLPVLRSLSMRSSPSSRKMVLHQHHSLEEDDNKSYVLRDHKTFVRSKSEEYNRQIEKLQQDYLFPLKEDLSEWINRILGTAVPHDSKEEESNNSYYLTPENFIDKLDNGVILCKVAKVIESQCDLTDIVIDRIKKELTIKSSSPPVISNGQQSNNNSKFLHNTRANNKSFSSSHNINNNSDNNNVVIANNRTEQGLNKCSRIPVKNAKESDLIDHNGLSHEDDISSKEGKGQEMLIDSDEGVSSEGTSSTPTPRPRRCNRNNSTSSPSITTPSPSFSCSSSVSSMSSSVSSPNSNGCNNNMNNVNRTFNGFNNNNSLSPSSFGLFSSFSGAKNSANSTGSMTPNNTTKKINVKLTPFKMSNIKTWSNARSQSFYARDNVSNFITWCRFLRVREAVIFESEDLVLHNNPRNVVLCLLEVARIVCKDYGFTLLPALVQLEKEIDLEIELEERMHQRRQEKLEQEKRNLKIKNQHNVSIQLSRPEESSSSSGRSSSLVDQVIQVDNNDLESLSSDEDEKTLRSVHTEVQCDNNTDNRVSLVDSGVDPIIIAEERSASRSSDTLSLNSTGMSEISSGCLESRDGTSSLSSNQPLPSQLDQKVMMIAKSFYGKKAKHGIQRLEEGKYRISGKIVFVRLLRDCHVMVRVGGGWDTLQHFLERHGLEEDISAAHITPSDLLPMDTRPSQTSPRRRDHKLSVGTNGHSLRSSASLPHLNNSPVLLNNNQQNTMNGNNSTTKTLSYRRSIKTPNRIPINCRK